jgi:twinkle protein
MGVIAAKDRPCIDSKGCGSSDAMQVYEDGTAFCFSCRKRFSKEQVAEEGYKIDEETIAAAEAAKAGVTDRKPPTFKLPNSKPPMPGVSAPTSAAVQKAKAAESKGVSDSDSFSVVATEVVTEAEVEKTPTLKIANILELPIRGFKERGITRAVSEFFGVRCSYDKEGEINSHYYPYAEGGFKHRTLPKKFSWVGESGKIFGKERFTHGGRRLIITEGEIDAMSVAQMNLDKYKTVFPVIALPGVSYVKHLLEIREWIRSFKEVVLMMDNDEPGKEALQEAIKIVGYDKAYIVEYPEGCKDANDILVKEGWASLYRVTWDAQPYRPASILSKNALWDAMVAYNNKAFVPYPPCLEGLNQKVKGMRTGEIALFVSGTGVGKSTLIREIVLHLVETTDSKIGILALEEAPGETARKLSAAKLNQNPADCPMSLDELKPGFDAVFDDDRVLVLDHQGSISDESIVDLLEFMALAGCKYIFIDHLTILISEGVEKLTGNEAQDRMMNDLLRLVKRNDVYVGLVSHLRKTGASSKAFEEGQLPNLDDIKGSGSTKQISMDILAFARDMTSEEESDRNRILMSVLKCRHTGLTGPVEGMIYNYKTGRLTRESEYVPDSFAVLDTKTIVVSTEKIVDSTFVAEF